MEGLLHGVFVVTIRRTISLCLIVSVMLAACDQSPTPTEPPLAGAVVPTRVPTVTPTSTPTVTPTPTFTHTPTATDTPTPTFTSQPTDTPIPTDTPQPTDTPAPTDTPTPEPSATEQVTGFPISYDETARGEITNQTYRIDYTFEAQRDDIVTIAMTALDESLDPFLVLLNPEGQEVASNDDADDTRNSRIDAFLIPESGTYTIVASRFSGDLGSTEGRFTLDVTNVADDLLTNTGDGTLEYGDFLTGRITDLESNVDYTLQASAGDVISLSMTATSGELDSLVALYSQDGRQLIFNDDDPINDTLDSYIREYTIPEDGSYIVRATRYNRGDGDTTGTYELGLTLIGTADAFSDDPFTPLPITLNETRTGALSSDHYLQLYRFVGRSFQEITVQMVATSNNLLPTLILLDPDGRPIARHDSFDYDSTTAILDNIVLNDSGSYTIVATRTEGNVGITSGSYTLLVTEGGGVPEFASLFQDIAYGDRVTDIIDAGQTATLYRFQGSRGDVLTAAMRSMRGDLDTLLTLQNAYGEEIARNDDNVNDDQFSNSEIANALLDEGGYYFLIASTYETETITRGEYALTLVRNEQIADPPYRAVLDPFGSQGDVEDGSDLLYLAVGDWTDDENEDYAVTSLLTFYLPTLQPGEEVQEAALDLSACYMTTDDVFEQFGEMGVYLEGTFASNLYMIGEGSGEFIDVLGECGALDVTDYVIDAYEAGRPVIQFYIEFDELPVIQNGEIDTVIFTSPALDVYVDE
jgi:hypothetical protein